MRRLLLASALLLPASAWAQTQVPTANGSLATVNAQGCPTGATVNGLPVVSPTACAGSSATSPSYTAVPPKTFSAPATVTVTSTSSSIFTAGTYSNFLLICTLPTSTTPVYFGVGSAAVIGSGIVISPGGGCVNFGGTSLPMPASNQAINAITATTQTVAIQGS